MEYIISITVGAIIGYVTNWLAIKMLFRPRKEIRIAGKRVPFTPGLIPKERTRISASVGKAIGEHILTKETLIEALDNDRVKKHINDWIGEKVKEFQSKANSLEELLKKLLAQRYTRVKEKVRSILVTNIVQFIKAEENKDKFTEITRRFIKKSLMAAPESLVSSDYLIKTKEFTISKLKELKCSKGFKAKLHIYIEKNIGLLEQSEKSLQDILPNGIIASVKSYIYNSREEICQGISKILKEPNVSNRLKVAIGSMISNNLNPLVAAFIKTDTVYNKLTVAMDDYFKEDENQKNVAMILNDSIQRLLEDRIGDLLKKISEEDRATLTKALVDMLAENVLTDTVIDNVFEELEKGFLKYASLDQMLTNINEEYDGKVAEFIIDRFLEYVSGENFLLFVDKLTGWALDEVGKTIPAAIMGEDLDKITDAITEAWEALFQRFLNNDAQKIIAAMDISNVVEERINSFDVVYTEEIILSLAKKELSAITWLGALLGAIMGILSPLLSNLY